LYLCVGSVYTGNFRAALDWKRRYDIENRFFVIDTGAASGRLAVAAMAAARRAVDAQTPQTVVAFAQNAAEKSREYLFLDRLKYLVAGGRLSRTKGFFGDLFGQKPIITPTAEGAVKAGLVRDATEQIDFALRRLEEELGGNAPGLILLQHADNRRWVDEAVKPAVAQRFSNAEIQVAPLSLTAGAHMGPGTWGVAFLPAAAQGRALNGTPPLQDRRPSS
jgi:DegV family protein with EDD domain